MTEKKKSIMEQISKEFASMHESMKTLSDLFYYFYDGVDDTAVNEEIEEEKAVAPATTTSKKFSGSKKPLPMKTAEKSSAKPSTRKEKEMSEKVPSADDDFTPDDLKSLSYNNLKKLAVGLGINAVGSREELVDKILDAKYGNPKTEKKTAAKSSAKSLGAKKPLKKEEPEEPEDDEITAKVKEAVKDMTDEEIATILTESGIRAKGKRSALIKAVVNGVNEGKISLDEEEEEESANEESETEEEAADETEDEDSVIDDTEELNAINDIEQTEMTEERSTALRELIDDLDDKFVNGGIKRKEMEKYVVDKSFATKDDVKSLTDDQLYNLYRNVCCYFIDDEGEEHDSGEAYEVNGDNFCCGNPLAEVDGTYVCEVCGTEYSAD